jgi:hypothetical protein
MRQYQQFSRKPTGPKTEASEFEVGPVKSENQEVRLAFGIYQTFYDILFGACKKLLGASKSDNPLVLLASKFKKFS